jgi:protein TonB
MNLRILCVLVGLMWAGAVKAESPNVSRIDALTSAPIDWLRLPSREDIQRYYPPDALKQQLEGRATITCSVNLRGQLHNCRQVSETPAGLSFGEAAVRMATIYKLRVTSSEGVPIQPATPVTFEVRFRPLPTAG